MAVRSEKTRQIGKVESGQDGASALERALSELSASQRLQKAAETLQEHDASELDEGTRDSTVIGVLMEGLAADIAGVARFEQGTTAVRLVSQRRSGPFQESASLDLSDTHWLARVRGGDGVELEGGEADMPARDAVLALLGTEQARIVPFRARRGESTGFLVVAVPTADEHGPRAMEVFLDIAARWIGDADAPQAGPDKAPAATPAEAESPTTAAPGRSRESMLVEFDEAVAGTRREGHGVDDVLTAIIDHVDQGIILFDDSLTILASNPQAAALLETPPGMLDAGASMADFFRFCADRGDYGDGDSDAQVAVRMEMATGAEEDYSLDRHFPDGRVVTCSRRAAGDGRFVVTYTDVTEWRQSKAALAERSELLEATIQHMDQGLFAFDRDLNILYATERAKTLLGVPREFLDTQRNLEDMIRFSSQRGDYGDGAVAQHAQEVLEKSRGTEWFTFERKCPGDITVMVRCHPRPEGGFVVTFTDITESKRQSEALLEATEALREQSDQLDSAFNGMSQGLAIFDADQRLIVCNPRYRELCGLSEEQAQPGMELADLMRNNARFDNGLDVEDAIARRYERALVRERYVETGDLPNGRVVEMVHEPLATGGWLGLFTDITERRFHEKALRDASDALKQKSNQLERMFNNMGRGVAMFDAERRLVICNELYASAFPLPDTLVEPGTPLEDIRDYCAKFVVESDVDRVVAPHPEHGAGREEFRLQLLDGRVLEVMREPLEDGGSMAIYQDITDRDRAEQQLRDYAAQLEEQQAVMKTILENLQQGVSLVDKDLTVLAINKRGMELLEFPEELLGDGANLEEFFRYNAERGEYGPGDVDELVATRVELARAFQPHRFERTRPDGTVIEVAGTPLPNSSGMVTTYTDVTEAKRHEAEVEALAQQLRTANMQLDAAFNSMNQGLAMFDAELRLVVRNKRYLEMFGLPEEVAKPGATLEEVTLFSIGAGNEGDPANILERRMEVARSRERIVFHRRMSDARTLEIIHEPLSDGGSIAIYLDVSARMEQEAKLRDYTAKLEASNRELQDFAYVASHDLQEPLRKIEAFGDRLYRKCGERLGEDGRMYVGRMQDSSRRLRTLINDLLAYSRVTTKAKPFMDVDLNLIVEEVLFDMDATIEEAGATVEVGKLPTLHADDTQMRQLVLNLVSNAIKFRKPETPPKVQIEASLIEDPEGVGGPESWCEISFTDNGIGFSNKYADRIFTIFQRLHARTTYEGTGIGLATCRKIAERHNGDIVADGRPGEGATFRVRLPLNQADEHDLPGIQLGD